MIWPWTRHRLDVTRALKEQAVHTRNEVSTIAHLMELDATRGPMPERSTLLAYVERLRQAQVPLMERVNDAQGWLRSCGAVKSTPRR